MPGLHARPAAPRLQQRPRRADRGPLGTDDRRHPVGRLVHRRPSTPTTSRAARARRPATRSPTPPSATTACASSSRTCASTSTRTTRRIIVHLLVELYARSLEEATEVLESSARGALHDHLAGRGVAPAGRRRRDATEPRLTRRHARRARGTCASPGRAHAPLPSAEALLERLELRVQLVRELAPNLAKCSRNCGSWARHSSTSTRSSSAMSSSETSSPRVSMPSAPTGGIKPIGVSLRRAVTGAAREHPRQHARVLAVAGPQEAAVVVLAEPVDVEDLRQLRARRAADLQPVGEVVGHVVAAERQHRERVEAQLADRAGRRGGLLRAHHRAEEHAVLPVERLGHERHHRRAPPAEQHRVDRHARRVLPLGRDRRVLRGRRR